MYETINLSFRQAELTDIDQIINLVNTAYRGELSKKGWTTEAELLGGQRVDYEEIEDIIADKHQIIILCFNDDILIGTVVVQNKIDCAYLGMLTVRSDLQAVGIGKKILAVAENLVARQWKIKHLEMTVIQQRNELIYWYIRRGYVPTGQTRPFPYDDPRFGEPKINDLKFVVLEKDLFVTL